MMVKDKPVTLALRYLLQMPLTALVMVVLLIMLHRVLASLYAAVDHAWLLQSLIGMAAAWLVGFRMAWRVRDPLFYRAAVLAGIVIGVYLRHPVPGAATYVALVAGYLYKDNQIKAEEAREAEVANKLAAGGRPSKDNSH